MNKAIFLTDKKVAERYATTRTTVWRWAKLGYLPKPYKIGPGATRWALVELEEAESRLGKARG